jgi:AraC family transcriptional regulator of adaptative response/methylated-DNA-[protein]-cysteine methyltransferase
MSTDQDPQLARMAEAISYLAERWDAPPTLDAAAQACGMSPWHFQRAFTRAVGVSPKRFTGFLTLGHAKTALMRDAPVLDAALGAGLSGPSRLHDLAIAIDAASPGEIKTGGLGLTMRYGTADTPFGPIFACASARGITRLAFIDGAGAAAALAQERAAWPRAAFEADANLAAGIASSLFTPKAGDAGILRLAPRGTNFQIKVWQALLAIPPGAVGTYRANARAIGAPQAARAVGGACGANPIALVIPCHRVVGGSGKLVGFSSAKGIDDKRWLLDFESDQPSLPLG